MDINNPLYDRLWGMDGIHPFGNPYEMEQKLKEQEQFEELETEVCEFLKGDFKTTIICKFNKSGYMVSHSAFTVNIAQDNAILSNLKEDLFKALDEERYEEVPGIQAKINAVRHLLEVNKPTL